MDSSYVHISKDKTNLDNESGLVAGKNVAITVFLSIHMYDFLISITHLWNTSRNKIHRWICKYSDGINTSIPIPVLSIPILTIPQYHQYQYLQHSNTFNTINTNTVNTISIKTSMPSIPGQNQYSIPIFNTEYWYCDMHRGYHY